MTAPTPVDPVAWGEEQRRKEPEILLEITRMIRKREREKKEDSTA